MTTKRQKKNGRKEEQRFVPQRFVFCWLLSVWGSCSCVGGVGEALYHNASMGVDVTEHGWRDAHFPEPVSRFSSWSTVGGSIVQRPSVAMCLQNRWQRRQLQTNKYGHKKCTSLGQLSKCWIQLYFGEKHLNVNMSFILSQENSTRYL